MKILLPQHDPCYLGERTTLLGLTFTEIFNYWKEEVGCWRVVEGSLTKKFYGSSCSGVLCQGIAAP